MDVEQLVSDQADPPDLHVCDHCHETHRNAVSAALCCDALSNDIETAD